MRNKRIVTAACAVLLAAVMLSSCSNGREQTVTQVSATSSVQEQTSAEEQSSEKTEESVEEEMYITIDGQKLSVEWEDNDSVAALKAMAEEAPVEIKLSMYGGFEQVGEIGRSLPRNDAEITTRAGDLMLYSGDKLVIFYGSNTWSYTRLGRIKDLSAKELEELLSRGDTVLTIEL